MRILIVADIEGVSGVTDPDQTRSGAAGVAGYEGACRLMTREVSSLAEGAFAGGAHEVCVADSHGMYRNIVFEELHPDVRLISGKPRQNGMMAGLSECGPWYGVFFSGSHAMAGSYGVLAHTINGRVFSRILVNDVPAGEVFLNATLAAEFSVPTLLASGDDCLEKEVQALLPGVVTVVVKKALSSRSAVHTPLQRTHTLLREAAQKAVAQKGYCTALSGPVRCEVQTTQPVFADAFSFVPGVERTGATTLLFTAEAMSITLQMLNSFSAMAASVT